MGATNDRYHMSTISRRLLLGGVTAGFALGRTTVAGGRTGPSADGSSNRLVIDGLDGSLLGEKFLELARQGGADCVYRSLEGLYGEGSFGEIYEFVDKHRDRATVATTVRDIRGAKQSGKLAFILGWQSADALDGPLRSSKIFTTLGEALLVYSQLGLRVVGICYNNSNLFGGGCLEPHEPLTSAGQRLVEQIHKRQLVLDIGGHTGEQTSFDAIEISQGVPVVCTHTNMAAINPNMRCISDKLAIAIAKTGGVIGITAVSDFHNRNGTVARAHGDHSPQVSLEKHLDQYDYLKNLVGVDHVAMAPDFVWGSDSQGEPPAEFSLNWPYSDSSVGSLVYVADFENISKLPNVVAGLRARGWTESELDKMLGGNWLRVYERIWGI